MALVVTSSSEAAPAATLLLPSEGLAASSVAAACRVVGTPEAHLQYSCRNHDAAQARALRASLFTARADCPCAIHQGFGRDCDSVYYWAVTLPLQIEAASAWADAQAGGAAVEVTVRAGSFAEAQRVLRRFSPRNAQLACLLDGAGGVRSVGGPNVTAPLLSAAPARPAVATPHAATAATSDPSPLALALLHAAWGSLLGRVGAAARPPPAWLSRLGWLPWARCCGPGVPLIVLSTLSAAGRALRRDAGRDAGALGALSASAMVAAAAVAAAALLAEARGAAAERLATSASLLPVFAALAFVAGGTALVAACVAEPLQRELARLAAAWRDVDSGAPADHPLGEPLPRRVTRALSSGRISTGGTPGRPAAVS